MTRLLDNITPQAQATARRLLDLREPLVPALSPKRVLAPRSTPPTEPVASALTSQSTTAPRTTLRTLGHWPWRTLLRRSLLLGLFLGAAFVGLSLTSLGLPNQLIIVYAAAALLFGIDSQRSFLIALIFLALVLVWTTLGNSDKAQELALYAFYFLAIGIACAMREVFWRPQQANSKP